MGLSKDERKLISVGSKELRERLSYNRDILRQLTTTNIRRAKVGQRYRERALEKMFKLAGVDYDVIRQRQTQEAKIVRNEIETLTKKSVSNALKVAKRHKDVIDRFQKSKVPIFHRMPGQNAESVTLGYIGMPSSFDLQDMGTPKNAMLTTSSQGAVLQFRWDTTVVDLWNPSITLNVNYLWTPPNDGILGVLSLATYNGTGSWAFPGSCDVMYPFVNISFSSAISIQQMDSFGDLHTEMAQAPGGIHEGPSGGCFPHSGHKAFDFVDYLQLPNNFLVEKNLPVKVTVTIVGDCFGLNTAGELDFSNDGKASGKSITLPGILFGFTAT